MEGRLPRGFCVKRLTDLPMLWSEQWRAAGARSSGLRAALSLAKLYQSTGRPAEAHAVLAPALEGFTPTPEMSEIAEALFERLAHEGEGAILSKGRATEI